MTFPNDDTGQVLAEMYNEGIDFSIIHKVVFFQLFEHIEDAQAMADHLAAKAPEMEVNLHADETPNVWDVDCAVNMLLDYDAIIAQEAEFEQLAAKFNGYNDGWGVEA
ncbi:ribonuclease E inhibitor RraB [Thalassotalea profundi]|uniref:Regulator of ribonuclease activity B domain-containing protein n=1 Tax=Thalassotalea profundi TaxID=2036687 RepID=A0ABQ3ISM8_9GAMM|nr:ribonuclease E inhibitor RraB [Thalassotalea profundi]GHE93441.1 hypothetical protein GCM10011501_23530 [Thalassotalea profundi]